MQNALTVALVVLVGIATGLIIHGFIIGISSTYRLNADGILQGIMIAGWGGLVGGLASYLAKFVVREGDHAK